MFRSLSNAFESQTRLWINMQIICIIRIAMQEASLIGHTFCIICISIQETSLIGHTLCIICISIQEASLIGLLDRYIWVWPPWDQDRHGSIRLQDETFHGVISLTNHDEFRLHAGRLNTHWTPRAFGNTTKRYSDLCGCLENLKKKEGIICLKLHVRFHIESPALIEGVVINATECRPERSMVLEFLREDKAVALLSTQRSDWLLRGGDNPLLLDIDEDYYGCWSSKMALLAAGIRLQIVNDVNGALFDIFNLTNGMEEKQADAVVVSVMELIVEDKVRCAPRSKTDRHTRGCNPKYLAAAIRLFMSDIMDKGGYITFNDSGVFRKCSGSVYRAINKLISLLHEFSAKQLAVLQETGICMIRYSKDYQFGVYPFNRVCLDYTGPDDFARFHSPSLDEIHQRSEGVSLMLSHLQQAPRLVTVTRSVRHGCTPRALFHHIESELLGAIKEHVLNNSGPIFYDSELLGGRQGWPFRYKFD
jgi:hypothetical protein